MHQLKKSQNHNKKCSIIIYRLIYQMQLIKKLQKLIPKRRLDIFGNDSLMNSTIPYYLLTILPATAILIRIPNPFIYISLIYAVFPLLDEAFSLDEKNPNNEERKQLEKRDPEFRVTLYLAMLMSWAAFFKMMNFLSTVQLSGDTFFQYIGIIFILTNLYSTQFAITHELMHKPGKFYRILATLHMSKLYYMHWTTSHLYYHHANICTENDPSTPKKGESLYEFLRKCIVHQWIDLYRDEKKKGVEFYRNQAVLSIFAIFVFSGFILFFYGFKHMIVHSIMAAGAVVYLQAITYIEHYGLKRKLLPNGQYEKVTIMHSWNAPHRFTNYLLFKLQRHSDHHQNSSKPFQTLASMQQSPFLPHGYSLMIVMSFFPKIWFKVMNPLAEEYGKLVISDMGKIDPKIKQNSAKQTRIFLAKTSVVCFSMLILSVLAQYY